MTPTATNKVRASQNLSHTSRLHSDDDVINRNVAERLKALLKANKIRVVNSASGMFRPRCDIFEDPPSNHVIAMFELPGVKRSEIALNLREGVLVVQGERIRPDQKHTNQTSFSLFPASSAQITASASGEDDSESKPRYVLEELRYGKFERKIALPDGIQDADIRAHMSEGMLIVTWPRQPTSQRSSAGTAPKATFASSK